MSPRSKFRVLLGLFLLMVGLQFTSCGNGGSKENSIQIDQGVFGPNVWGTSDTFRGAGIVNDEKFLFGGPLARGRSGDILLQNDKIRIIIQKPTRTAGVGMFGGNIIDADRFRPSSEPGQDQFGVVYPLVNLAWTAHYQRLEIINADFANGPVVLRATAALDVYDYIQTTIVVPFAEIFENVVLIYSDQFNDIFDPFEHNKFLKNLNPIIVTDYILKKDVSYVIVETKFQNDGEESIQLPVGDWVNGSGMLEPFVPKQGFVRTPLVNNTPALIYQALEDDVEVSYGMFFNPIQHIKEEGTLPGAATLSVAGVTPMVYGEGDLLKILPLGSGEPDIHFTIDPGVRTLTRYFVVGNGDIASVMDAGLEAIGVSKVRMSGKVIDANGQPVTRARVILFDGESPVTVSFSDPNGNFEMDVSSGKDAKAKLFGSGSYTVRVYKEGFVRPGSSRAGKCSGGILDSEAKIFSGMECKLGESGTVTAVVEVDGIPGPARITIVGFDPSPIHTLPIPDKEGFGNYRDIGIEERPYGVIDVLYLDPQGKIFPKGNQRIVSNNSFRIEPGEYEIFFTRGMEYSVDSKRITVSAGGNVAVQGTLKKVLDTPGYVSGDFHVHGINSPDSPFLNESRIRAAMAEGLDVMVNTDHEFVTDNQPLIENLGYAEWVTALPGDEITPLAYGHMVTWPLTPDISKPDHGAYDYTYVPEDDILNPDHDMVQDLSQVILGVDQTNPGTQVFSIAHITDKALGNFAISRVVTSPAFGVEPLSTYADPVLFRLPANTNAAGGHQAPFPMGTSSMFTLDFTSLGVIIGTWPDIFEHLMETSLPTYFNILNLGKICSATGDSDTHSQIEDPLAVPRNLVISSVDPRDGIGGFSEIDPEELAVNVNAGRLIVSNGIFINAKLKSAQDPTGVTVGGTLTGTGQVTLELTITSNEFFDWDTVEIYANTEPTPAKDDLSGLTDLSSEEFHSVTFDHEPKYLMTPLTSFHKAGSGDAKLTQTVVGGVRRAELKKDFNFSEDTWIVVVVSGSPAVRSTFPYVTKAANSDIAPDQFLDTLDNDPVKIKGIQAFAFTNPIFVDVDGNGFEAKYIRDGTSPLAK